MYFGKHGVAHGYAEFERCIGPLTKQEWNAQWYEHRVDGDSLPYGSHTYGWYFKDVVRLNPPAKYVHKQGAVAFLINSARVSDDDSDSVSSEF